jgi:hypothetical protein
MAEKWSDVMAVTFSNRSQRLAELVTKTNAMLENLKDRGLFKEAAPDHPSFNVDDDLDFDGDSEFDEDEPDYLSEIRHTARGTAP